MRRLVMVLAFMAITLEALAQQVSDAGAHLIIGSGNKCFAKLPSEIGTYRYILKVRFRT